ncbi:MAG: hypothetical protein HKM26_06430 [Winogradskyella sp.]|nr:hypothetical protein [Winogradskyella sp.]
MSDFNTIQQKLEQFIKRYYANELLRGAILFFAIGLLYFLATLFVEYMLWLNPTGRTFLFWAFISVEAALFIRFIVFPVTKLFKLRRGIDLEEASIIIGNHFPEVSDKLLNVLQLNKNKSQSDLLLASIEQKSSDLKPIPFQLAVSFRSNLKYVKYAAIPVLIVLLTIISGKINWFSDSYTRVINYSTAYEPPAPFEFFVLNTNLKATEGQDYKLEIHVAGEVLPENAQIVFNGQSYFLSKKDASSYEYTFIQPKESIEFTLQANGVTSKPYELSVIKTPNLVNLKMKLQYPGHTNRINEVIENTGTAVIPEGTKVTWLAKTKTTTKVKLVAEDTINFKQKNSDNYELSKGVFNNLNYNITTSNDNLEDYEDLSYSLAVIKDAFPKLEINVKTDSIDQQTLYFYGQASDDYGIRQLSLVYYPADKESEKVRENLAISKSNFDEFISSFPGAREIEEGVAYNLFFELKDNDAVNGFKTVKSAVFNYRKRTKEEEEQKQLQEQSKTINDINKTFDKLNEQDKKLEELSKTQKEKEALNFNDKKKFEDFLKRQKQQEELMKNFNKKLQENLEEFQKENEDDQFKEDLKERLKENESQLKKDEKLLEELEKLVEKINKEEFSQKLEELAKQNKNKKRSMQQLLELTKRFYVAKKIEKTKQELEELAKEQEEQSNKEENNTKEKQEELNKKFEDIKKELESLKKDNSKLRKPMSIPEDKPLEESIEKDQKEAAKELEKMEAPKQEGQKGENMQNAQQKQKNAAKKLKQMSEMLESALSMGGGGSQMAEDIEMLRQILDNLILFSFDQEALMDQFSEIDINHNQYGKFIVAQNNLKEHFEHVDDSLFALSLRQPKISEEVSKQITDVYFNIDKALDLLSENRLYQGVASQQYVITASNELADILSDILDNMEQQMNPGQGQGEGDQQLPDIIMSQEQLNKEMEEGVKEGEKGEQGESGEQKEGKQEQEGENEGTGEGKNGKEGKEGKEGKDGNDSNGENGNKNGEGEQKNDGYGEGGNEELNGKLFEIYQKQQQIRKALEDKIGQNNNQGQISDLIKQMEDVELDLLNKGFTNQTLQKMMDLQHQLLKLENATFTQGQDSKRKSKTNVKDFNSTAREQLVQAKKYFNTTEILNREALPLKDDYKKKVQTYFKNKNDQF